MWSEGLCGVRACCCYGVGVVIRESIEYPRALPVEQFFFSLGGKHEPFFLGGGQCFTSG